MKRTFWSSAVALLLTSLTASAEVVKSPTQERFSVSISGASDAVPDARYEFVVGERVILRLQLRDEADIGAFTLVWIDPFECVITTAVSYTHLTLPTICSV